MIVVDTSAIIAMMLCEPNYEAIEARMLADKERIVPATAVVEATMVLAKKHADPKLALDGWLKLAALVLVPINDAIVREAQDAFLKFGKGRHKAALNFGDCFSYATAKALDAPLLFVGNDFVQTDIRPA